MPMMTLDQVPEDAAGQITPSLITGYEFGMPTTTTTSDTPHRPRPLSMPPQSFTPSSVLAGNSAATTDVSGSKQDENSLRRRNREEHPSSSKPSRSNRILGDYTLSKTLGAGSMGKVKLATHNVTGEKVDTFFSISI